MKTTLILFSLLLAGNLLEWERRNFAVNDSLLDQPYSLTVEEITPDLIILCRRDPNCMDLQDARNLPTDEIVETFTDAI
jgi:hypothetical protein